MCVDVRLQRGGHLNCDIEDNNSVLCGIFMTFRIHLLPPHLGSADERGGKAGTNYRVPAFRKSVRGQNMLHFCFIF